MILFDHMGHMVSTESAEELHEFARKLRLKREWFQTRDREDERYDHYDLTTARMRKKALAMGARFVRSKDIVMEAWWACR